MVGDSDDTPVVPTGSKSNQEDLRPLDVEDDGYDSDADEQERLDFIELELEALNMCRDDRLGGAEGPDEEELNFEDEDQEVEAHAGTPTSSTDQDETMQGLEGEQEQEKNNDPSVPIPEPLKRLREELKGGYTCPPFPPLDCGEIISKFKDLTQSQIYSLRHFIVWKKTGGTVIAYQLHAKLLEAAGNIEILSLHLVRKLARDLTTFSPIKVDMCPRSCIAYTGKYKDLDKCPYTIPASKNQRREVCGKPRYRVLSTGKKCPMAYFQVLSLRKKIEALFANEDTARLLRYRDNCLKQVLEVISKAKDSAAATSNRKYSDFADSEIHSMQRTELGLFKDPCDVAFAISTDGAQLTMKKLSNTWVLIIILFNFPPEIRYKTSNIMVNYAIPGPHSPGDIESFLYPLFEEFAQGSEGFWMWDALDSSYFIHRFYPVLGNGDMLGSAKINGMAGHTALHGDRFSMVPAAKNRLQGTGAKSLYYPISPPQNDVYNPKRPAHIDLLNLPLRSQNNYYKTITRLAAANISGRAQAKITTETGVSKLPLCAASPAFIHPTFFPADPFHLFYENIMAFIWDIWTIHSTDPDPVHVPDEKLKLLGASIPDAMTTLPPAFCGPIRNTYEKRNSQYKVYEWMAILHWFFVPMAIELRLPMKITQNFAKLVRIVEFAMTPLPRSEVELAELEILVKDFLEDFEAVYVQNIPENISRMRLCIFQIIHVPRHIKWNGSMRVGSQAAAERIIGELGRKIMSQKSPYANLSNHIYEAELIKILCLYHPALDSPTAVSDTSAAPKKSTPFSQEHRITIKARQNVSGAIAIELETVSAYLLLHYQLEVDFGSRLLPDGLSFRRWGKLRVRSGNTLRSRLSEMETTTARQYRWFEADDLSIENVESRSEPTNRIYGEALAFYSLKSQEADKEINLAIYIPLNKVKNPLKCTIQGRWAEPGVIKVIECSKIHDIVGIWQSTVSENVYILRKHPGLGFLSAEEKGQPAEEGDDE